MTLEQPSNSLPDGLHDAELNRICVDYSSGKAVFDVNIDVGVAEPDGELYRPARLVFGGVQFVVIDPPKDRSNLRKLSTIDVGEGQPPTAPMSLPALDEGAFLVWIFIFASNSFIRIAAQAVTLEWVN